MKHVFTCTTACMVIPGFMVLTTATKCQLNKWSHFQAETDNVRWTEVHFYSRR